MAQITAQHQAPASLALPPSPFRVLAPSAIATPARLRERELAKARQAPRGSDSPALRALRAALAMQIQ